MKKAWLLVLIICGLVWPQVAAAVTVTRQMPEKITPGEPFEVVLKVEADDPAAVGIVEKLPRGCAFSGQSESVPGNAFRLEDAKAGKVAFAAFGDCELRYQVVAESAPGPFTGVFVDMTELSPKLDEGAERFQAVAPASGREAELAKSVTTGNTPIRGKKSLPGDNGDNVLTRDETSALICDYLLGKGPGRLDDVCDAAYVFAVWGGKPKKLKDMAGREAVFYRPVERIITTNPDNSRTIIALGRGDMIVGTDECTVGACICARRGNRLKHPKAAPKCWSKICEGNLDKIPQTSTRKTVNQELMAALIPDAIMETTFWSSRADDLAIKVGVPVVVAGADFSMESFYDQIMLIGRMLDKQDRAKELVGTCRDFTAVIQDRIRDIPENERPRVYFAPRGASKGFYDPKEGRDFTRTYRIYEPLDLAGGRNVAKEITKGTEVNVSVEQVIAWNPDYIFVACSSPEDSGVDFILESKELASINAIKKGQVYNVLYPHCRGRPAPRNLVNILIFAKLMYPDLFKDMDLMQRSDALYKEFLNVDGAFSEYARYLQYPLEYEREAGK